MWPSCKSDVPVVYKDLISNVIESSRPFFIEEGCDEGILELLEEIWLRKLTERNAIPKCSVTDIKNNNVQKNSPAPVNTNKNKQSSQKKKVTKKIHDRQSTSNSSNIRFRPPKGVTLFDEIKNKPSVLGENIPDFHEDHHVFNLNLSKQNNKTKGTRCNSAVKTKKKRKRKKNVPDHKHVSLLHEIQNESFLLGRSMPDLSEDCHTFHLNLSNQKKKIKATPSNVYETDFVVNSKNTKQSRPSKTVKTVKKNLPNNIKTRSGNQKTVINTTEVKRNDESSEVVLSNKKTRKGPLVCNNKVYETLQNSNNSLSVQGLEGTQKFNKRIVTADKPLLCKTTPVQSFTNGIILPIKTNETQINPKLSEIPKPKSATLKGYEIPKINDKQITKNPDLINSNELPLSKLKHYDVDLLTQLDPSMKESNYFRTHYNKQPPLLIKESIPSVNNIRNKPTLCYKNSDTIQDVNVIEKELIQNNQIELISPASNNASNGTSCDKKKCRKSLNKSSNFTPVKVKYKAEVQTNHINHILPTSLVHESASNDKEKTKAQSTIKIRKNTICKKLISSVVQKHTYKRGGSHITKKIRVNRTAFYDKSTGKIKLIRKSIAHLLTSFENPKITNINQLVQKKKLLCNVSANNLETKEQTNNFINSAFLNEEHFNNSGDKTKISQSKTTIKKLILKRKIFKNGQEVSSSFCDLHFNEKHIVPYQFKLTKTCLNAVKNNVNWNLLKNLSVPLTMQPTFNNTWHALEVVKIILPSVLGMPKTQRSCIIQVPNWLLKNTDFSLFLKPFIKQVRNLETSTAECILQNLLNEAVKNINENRAVVQCDGPTSNFKVRLFRKLKNSPIRVTKKRLGEAEIDSDDDATDQENSSLIFESNNVIMCKSNLVKRRGNKWKIHLTDGIMHLNGKDYVFQSANGTVEW